MAAPTNLGSVRIGMTVYVQQTFLSGGTVHDPTTVTFKATSPVSKTVTTGVFGTDPNLTKLSTGVYQYTVTLNEPGEWEMRWTGTGLGSPPGTFVQDCIIVVDRSINYP